MKELLVSLLVLSKSLKKEDDVFNCGKEYFVLDPKYELISYLKLPFELHNEMEYKPTLFGC